MKKYFLRALLAIFLIGILPLTNHSSVEAKGKKTVHVKSYTKKDGTKVTSHKRSKPSKK